MPDNNSLKSSVMHQAEGATPNNTITFRVPKPNLQVVVLGLVAFITLFQTIQLLRIGATAGSPVKAAPAAVITPTGGSGSNSDVPESMVGGC